MNRLFVTYTTSSSSEVVICCCSLSDMTIKLLVFRLLQKQIIHRYHQSISEIMKVIFLLSNITVSDFEEKKNLQICHNANSDHNYYHQHDSTKSDT